MTEVATGRPRPDLVAAELGAWIERLEAALAPLAAGDDSDIASSELSGSPPRTGWR